MFNLFGVRYDHDPRRDIYESAIDRIPQYFLVARFSDEAKAKEYLENSKTENYKEKCAGDCAQQFKVKSVLHHYCAGWVEKDREPLPFDPSI